MFQTPSDADSTTATALSTPVRGKATTSSGAKRTCLAMDDGSSLDALDHFDLASARAKSYARILEVELQTARDQLADAMQRLEEKHGVKSIEQEAKERKERDRKRPPPANVCLDMSNLSELLEEYADYVQAGTDGKGALIITIPPPTDDPALAVRLLDTLRSSVRLAASDQAGIVLYGPHRGATVKVVGREADGKLLARSIGSHTASTLVEGQPIDKWSNNQTLLLDANSIGCMV